MSDWDKATATDRALVRAMVTKVLSLAKGPVTPEIIGDQWMAEMLDALSSARREAIQGCADYVRNCGTASHPNGYGDWCGGEVDPIKLLTGIANVLDRKAEDAKP